MLMPMLSADLFRARRTPELLIAPLIVLLASCYGAFSLIAPASGGSAPALVLLTPGSGLAAPAVAPSITGALGATCLSGGLVPVVGSVAVASFLFQGLASGCSGGLAASGAGRAELIGETLVVSALTGAFLLAVGAAPYLACYALGLIGTPYETSADVGAAWSALALLHVTMCSFLAGSAALLTRRLWAGVASAGLFSSGAADMLLAYALKTVAAGSPVAETIRLLLPDSIADALSASPLDLTANYVGNVALFPAALLIYLGLIAATAAVALAVVRRCDLLCRRSS